MNEDIIEKLKSALQKDGDFPASAQVVNRLRELTNDPRTTAQQVTEVILTEPSLSTRILHLVNSAMFRRSKPIVTVSQAVVAVGMKSIADLCGGIVLLQRFVPLARKSSAFAGCFKRSMVTSLLASSFSADIGGKGEGTGNELGYISGFFAEIGTLLLAYYFPKVYEIAEQRSQHKNISLGESLFQITGYTPIDLSVEVIKALGLPNFYVEVLTASTDFNRLLQPNIRSLEEEKVIIAGKSSFSGSMVSLAIAQENPTEVDRVLNVLESQFGVKKQQSAQILANLPKMFKDHCDISEVPLPPLPDFLKKFDTTDVTNSTASANTSANEASFHSFMDDIKLAVQNREPLASIITSGMEALKFAMGFDRVILMLFDSTKKNMTARMAIGVENFKPGFVTKTFNETDSNSINISMKDGKLVFQGDALLDSGWPFVYLPIGTSRKGAGLIYADRCGNPQELTDRDKANISILFDLMSKSLTTIK